MTRDAGELATSLQDATAAQFRGRLLARGQAQSMIRRNGELPEDAPQFSAYLDDDLLNYSYALISTSLQLLDAIDAEAEDIDRDEDATRRELAQNGFIQASYALEAATGNTEPVEGLAFHRLIAGAASHLGGYAARAVSLMQTSIQSGRLTPMEATLADIVLRDLDQIEARTIDLRSSPEATDDALLEALEGRRPRSDTTDTETTNAVGDSEPASEDLLDVVGPVGLLLTEQYHSAVAGAPRSTKHWRIHAASLPRRVDGSRRGSTGPLLVSEMARRRTLFVTVTHSVSPAVRHLAGRRSTVGAPSRGRC